MAIFSYKKCYLPNALRPTSFSNLDLYCEKHVFLSAMKKPDLDIQKILFPILRFDGITLKLNNRQTDRRNCLGGASKVVISGDK